MTHVADGEDVLALAPLGADEAQAGRDAALLQQLLRLLPVDARVHKLDLWDE